MTYHHFAWLWKVAFLTRETSSEFWAEYVCRRKVEWIWFRFRGRRHAAAPHTVSFYHLPPKENLTKVEKFGSFHDPPVAISTRSLLFSNFCWLTEEDTENLLLWKQPVWPQKRFLCFQKRIFLSYRNRRSKILINNFPGIPLKFRVLRQDILFSLTVKLFNDQRLNQTLLNLRDALVRNVYLTSGRNA